MAKEREKRKGSVLESLDMVFDTILCQKTFLTQKRLQYKNIYIYILKDTTTMSLYTIHNNGLYKGYKCIH